MRSEDHATPEAVREQLERVITSQDFDASGRNHRFLQYVVEETLAGRGEHIKAYSIATSAVFGRDSTFDALSDPIVRIEASRLRRSLERYYLTTGKHDPIRIEIPKGAYVPTFRPGYAGSAAPLDDAPGHDGQEDAILARHTPFATGCSSAAAVLSTGPAIFVASFDNDGADSKDDAFVRGFTRELIVALTRFGNLAVFGPETIVRHNDIIDPRASAREQPIDFVVAGGVTVSAKRLYVAVSLADAQTGKVLWADTFVRDVTGDGPFQIRDFVAQQVVQALTQSDGVVFRGQSRQVELQSRRSRLVNSD